MPSVETKREEVSKVIWPRVALATHIHLCSFIHLYAHLRRINHHNIAPLGNWTPSWTHTSLSPNGTSIVLAQLTRVPNTEAQRPRYVRHG